MFVALLMGVLLPVAVRCACSGSPSVTIKNGTVEGVCDATNGIEKFLGIPFAEPPVGDMRLRQAVPLRKSFETLQASRFGPSCYARGSQGDGSEDCLTLNIWRPTGQTSVNETIPVLVWLYGGGLASGSTADPTFEGTSIVRISSEIQKPIILVTVNYRLGAFGFLNGREMAELGLLNMGMLDQRLALQWIQDNIGAFGGDATKVTLAGESAGAVSIYSHMMAFGGRDDGLFRAAVLQSGGAFPLTKPDTQGFQNTFDALINSTCSSVKEGSAEEKLDCLRKLPVDTFRSKVGSSTGQSVDGDFSRTSIQRALPAGQYLKVPTMIGAKGYFRPQLLPNETVSTLINMYSEDPKLGCPYSTGNVQFSPGRLDKMACSIFGDIVQIAPARMIAQTLASDGVPVYKYRYNHLQHNTSDVSRGISTGMEQAYVFSNRIPDHPWDQNMAYVMSVAWISFAHDLDPNAGSVGTGLPEWPRYDKDASDMVLNGYGCWVEEDVYRSDAIAYIIDKVLPDGAL